LSPQEYTLKRQPAFETRVGVPSCGALGMDPGTLGLISDGDSGSACEGLRGLRGWTLGLCVSDLAEFLSVDPGFLDRWGCILRLWVSDLIGIPGLDPRFLGLDSGTLGLRPEVFLNLDPRFLDPGPRMLG
jgi:hypothetical protein